MKVVYRKTILEYIQIERVRALAEGREIEKIVLTVKEGRQLHLELAHDLYWGIYGELLNEFNTYLLEMECLGRACGPQPKLTVMGIDIEVSR